MRPPSSAQAAQLKATPLPWRKVMPILILLFSEAFNGYSIFSYVSYMVIDLLPSLEGDKTKLGYYAGALGTAFYGGQFLSSFIWGKMSDRYGRRPILLSGTFGTLVCSVAFGFSTSYVFAITVRAFGGLLNGNLGVVKTYLGEVTDSTNQAKAFAYFGLVQGAGGIIGAMLGGYLARPALQYPSVFDANGFFAHYPYCLVNAISGFILFVGVALAYVYLTENTRAKGFRALPTQADKEAEHEVQTEQTEQQALANTDIDAEHSTEHAHMEMEMSPLASQANTLHVHVDTEQTLTQTAAQTQQSQPVLATAALHVPVPQDTSPPRDAALHAGDTEKDKLALVVASVASPTDKIEHTTHTALTEHSSAQHDTMSVRLLSPSSALSDVLLHAESHGRSELDAQAHAHTDKTTNTQQEPHKSQTNGYARLDAHAADDEGDKHTHAHTDTWSILRDRSAILTCVQYALLGWMFLQHEEIWPVWAVNDVEDGGLNFATSDIGTVGSISGVSIVLIQLGLYPFVNRRLGHIGTFRFALLLCLPTFLAYPLLNLVVQSLSSGVFWFLVICTAILRQCVGQLSFTAIICMVNNSVTVDHMAETNGFGQSLVAFTRGTGPIIGGNLLAWSLNNGLAFPFNYWFPYFTLCIFALSIFGLSFLQERSLDLPKAEADALARARTQPDTAQPQAQP